MNAMRKRIRVFGPYSQQGAALVIAVMILLLLTVIGIYAVTTSTLETKIAGNERLLKDAFFAADGGIDYGRRVIELVLNNQNLPGGANPYNLDELKDEIRGFAEYTGCPVRPTIGNSVMEIDVDRIKAEDPSGYSGEFGVSTSEKKTSVYYAVGSVSTGIAGTSSKVQATYRHVIE